MATKTLNTRIINKHDTAYNWSLATNFIPNYGEIIIYDPDENCNYSRAKIGDGNTHVEELPFINEIITNAEIDEICGTAIYVANEVSY